jgi:hypothetical protein
VKLQIIKRILAKGITQEHHLECGVGYFVGCVRENPYVTYSFSENSLTIQSYGDKKKVVDYSNIVSVILPGTTRSMPVVVAWAEGYFMKHSALLKLTDEGEIEIFGGVYNGKSEVYIWFDLVQSIVRRNRI